MKTILTTGVSMLALAGMLFAGTPSAEAVTFTVYTDKTAWTNALITPFVTEDFSDATLNTGLSVVSGYDSAGVTGGVWHDRANDNPNLFTTWSFTSSTYAFGGNWDLAVNKPGEGLQFNILGNLINPEIPNSYTGGFFGIIADMGFNSVIVQAGTQSGWQETYDLDNLVYSYRQHIPSQTPEPTTMVLFGTGLAGMFAWRMKKGRA